MKGLLNVMFGAHAQVVIGALMVLLAFVSWPIAALTFASKEPQFIVALSELALIFSGYGVVATGLGYRATERVETAVVENIENVDSVEVNGKH